MSSVEWRHNINLPGAGRTSGFYDPADDLELARVPAGLDGERVLDVGCSDGGHSFLCEERGATVLGIDDQSSPRNEGRNNFAFTKSQIDSSVEYRQGRVADLIAEQEPPFDRILHFNVLYHVEDLLGEATALRALLRTGRTLHLKTKFLTSIPARATSLVPMQLWLRQRPRISFVEAGIGGDLTCFFVPSIPAVIGLLRRAGFTDVALTAVVQDRAYFSAVAE